MRIFLTSSALLSSRHWLCVSLPGVSAEELLRAAKSKVKAKPQDSAKKARQWPMRVDCALYLASAIKGDKDYAIYVFKMHTGARAAHRSDAAATVAWRREECIVGSAGFAASHDGQRLRYGNRPTGLVEPSAKHPHSRASHGRQGHSMRHCMRMGKCFALPPQVPTLSASSSTAGR